VSTESSSESTSPMATMKGAAILKSRAHSKHTPSRKLFAREGTRARPSPNFRMPTRNRNVNAWLLRCGVALRETAGEVGQRCASAAARQNTRIECRGIFENKMQKMAVNPELRVEAWGHCPTPTNAWHLALQSRTRSLHRY
jgi:hypothetical protein